MDWKRSLAGAALGVLAVNVAGASAESLAHPHPHSIRSAKPAPHGGDADEFEEQREALAQELIERLEDYGDWCRSRKLHLERSKVMESLLDYAPDHAAARRLLGFRKGRDGAWEPPAKPKTFRNYNKGALAESAKRKAEATRRYVTGMAELAYAQEDRASQAYEQACAEVLKFDPDHAGVREHRGEVKFEGDWVLRETAAAKEGRRALNELVREAFEQAAEPSVLTPTKEERALGVDWTHSLKTPRVHVVGSGDLEEVQMTVQALEATHRVFAELFGRRASYPSEGRFYLLANAGEKEALLGNYPGLSARQRDELAALDGTGFPGQPDIAFWSESRPRRIDGTVRLGLGWLVSEGFRVTVQRAWIYEGLGLYLTRALVRTRLTWCVQASAFLQADEDVALRARLLDPDTNWMQEAKEILASDAHPSFESIFPKDPQEFTTEDMLLSYVLVAYLIEAHADELADFLDRIGRGASVAGSLERLTGFRGAVLEKRLETWLSQRR